MKQKGIKVGDIVNFEIFPLNNSLRKLWGRGKHLKIDAQKVKDELRKEDYEDFKKMEKHFKKK